MANHPKKKKKKTSNNKKKFSHVVDIERAAIEKARLKVRLEKARPPSEFLLSNTQLNDTKIVIDSANNDKRQHKLTFENNSGGTRTFRILACATAFADKHLHKRSHQRDRKRQQVDRQPQGELTADLERD